MAWLGVGQERERGGERIIWRGFHEINRYFHRDLSSISFRFFSSILSVRTSWVQLRADPPSIEQKILILPFVSILIVTRRRHENARESLSLFGLLSSFIPFGVFLRFLPSRPSWALAVLCRNSIAFTGAFPFSTRTNRTAGIQLKESTSKGNHLDQRERERKRGRESQQVYKGEMEVYIYIYKRAYKHICRYDLQF